MGFDLDKIDKLERSKPAWITTKGLSEILNQEISFSSSAFSIKQKERLFKNLALLIEAGLNLKAALSVMAEEQKNRKYRTALSKIEELLTMGNSFSISLKKSKKLTQYDYYSVQIGEESGNLTRVLKSLGSFYERKIEQRRNLISALIYPLIIFLTAFGTVFFMLKFVVPMFKDIFDRLKGDLPPLTEFIVWLSDWIDRHSFALFLFFILLLVIQRVSYKKKRYQRAKAWVILHIPLLNGLTKTSYLSQFSQSMNLLISSGVPLIRAISLTREMIPFLPLQEILSVIEKDIEKGLLLNESMAKSNFFEKRFISLIRVAEETNQLSAIFGQISEQLTKEMEYQSKMISSILEPLIIMFLGIIVAIILIAMYLPMFQLNTVIQ